MNSNLPWCSVPIESFPKRQKKLDLEQHKKHVLYTYKGSLSLLQPVVCQISQMSNGEAIGLTSESKRNFNVDRSAERLPKELLDSFTSQSALSKSYSEILSKSAKGSNLNMSTESITCATETTESNKDIDLQSKHLENFTEKFYVYSSTFRSINFEKFCPRGLVNMGNTCFINVTLQAMLFCSAFNDFLDFVRRNLPLGVLSSSPIIDAIILFYEEFDKDLQHRGNGAYEDKSFIGEPFIPERVYSIVRNDSHFKRLERGCQQDAEEFLGMILDGLQDEFSAINKTIPQWSNITMSYEFRTNAVAKENGWTKIIRKPNRPSSITRVAQLEATPITKIFSGRLMSTISRKGMRDSNILEPFYTLQIDIQSKFVSSVEEALLAITEPENFYMSEHKTLASKEIHIESLPEVLILHLKRFTYDENGIHKNYKCISFPMKLEIPATCIAPTNLAVVSKYNLFAVIYHHGASANGGHYTVDVKYKDSWLQFDDISVVQISEEEFSNTKNSKHNNLDRTPYLLFYEQYKR